MTENTTTYCINHPRVETTLRCNQCDSHICAKCAIRTPTGYRCKSCVSGQQKIFNTAQWTDYLMGFFLAGFLSTVASFLVSLIGFIGLWGIFLMAAAAPTAGMVIAESVRYVTRKHRARSLYAIIVVGVIMGSIPMFIFSLLSMDVYGILFQAGYLILVVPTVYSRLSGIQLFK